MILESDKDLEADTMMMYQCCGTGSCYRTYVRRLSGMFRRLVGVLLIYVTNISFKLHLLDTRLVGPLNSWGVEHVFAGISMGYGCDWLVLRCFFRPARV